MTQVKKLSSGRFGVYLNEKLIGTSKTQDKADEVARVILYAFDEQYADGYSEGYDNGVIDGENQ